MAADKPILAIMEDKTEIVEMIDQHSIGWAVSAGNPEALAQLFLDISQNFYTKSLDSSRRVLIENYSEQIAMKKIVSVIEEVRLGK